MACRNARTRAARMVAQMSLDEAIAAARRVADEAGIATVQVIDRTAGPRERDIQQHGGDHTIHMDRLDDDDMEEGEPGPGHAPQLTGRIARGGVMAFCLAAAVLWSVPILAAGLLALLRYSFGSLFVVGESVAVRVAATARVPILPAH